MTCSSTTASASRRRWASDSSRRPCPTPRPPPAPPTGLAAASAVAARPPRARRRPARRPSAGPRERPASVPASPTGTFIAVAGMVGFPSSQDSAVAVVGPVTPGGMSALASSAAGIPQGLSVGSSAVGRPPRRPLVGRSRRPLCLGRAGVGGDGLRLRRPGRRRGRPADSAAARRRPRPMPAPRARARWPWGPGLVDDRALVLPRRAGLRDAAARPPTEPGRLGRPRRRRRALAVARPGRPRRWTSAWSPRKRSRRPTSPGPARRWSLGRGRRGALSQAARPLARPVPDPDRRPSPGGRSLRPTRRPTALIGRPERWCVTETHPTGSVVRLRAALNAPVAPPARMACLPRRNGRQSP